MTDREIALQNEKWDDVEAAGSLPEPWRPRPKKVNEAVLRMRGHNKDGHPANPQVKVALVCSPGGGCGIGSTRATWGDATIP